MPETIAQLALLLILFALLRAYIEGGWPQVRAWWRAKLVGS